MLRIQVSKITINCHLPVFLACLFAAGFVRADQDVNESTLSATATFTTDYIWHGYSKSDGNPVFQTNLDYHHASGFFGGLWFSQVDFGDDRVPIFKHISEFEFIPYFGYSYTISDDWHGDVQWNRYLYNSEFFNAPGDYNEFSTTINFRDLLSARIGVTDNGYGRAGVYPDYELTGRYPITDLFDF